MEVYIKEEMTRQGITVKELAGRLGKSIQHTSNIVNGGKNLSMNTLQLVADALQVSPWRLLAPEGVGVLPSPWPSPQPSFKCPYCGHTLTVEIK